MQQDRLLSRTTEALKPNLATRWEAGASAEVQPRLRLRNRKSIWLVGWISAHKYRKVGLAGYCRCTLEPGSSQF